MDDAELLKAYAKGRSEAAFTELVARHVDFVFATAQRLLGGDAHRADDVVQHVFSELARKAASLLDRPVLAGWLYLTARNTSAAIVRGERRRARREMEAQIMQELDREEGPVTEWARIRPVIDRALSALNPRDRDVVLMRFFQRMTFPEIGKRLSISDDAARLRVGRSLDRVRSALSRLGVTSTTGAVAAALGGQAAICAPAGLAASAAAAALTGAGPALGGITAGAAIPLMITNKVALAAVGAAILAGAGGMMWQLRVNSRLAEQAAALEAQAGGLPAAQAENRRLAAALDRINGRQAALRARIDAPAQVRSLENEAAALQAELATRAAPATADNASKDRVLAAGTGLLFNALKPLIDARKWGEAKTVVESAIPNVPADSYDRYFLEDTIAKVCLQESNLFDGLAHLEEADRILRTHPGFADSKTALATQKYIAQIDTALGAALGGSAKPGQTPPAAFKDSPDQWFPAAGE
jgi:RNA polymerase sigma factor (sigma-70 family)